MNSKFKFLVEWLSAIALIFSLIFLAIEVKQSNSLARATVRQTINDNDVDYLETFLDSNTIPIANYKLKSGQELSKYEIQQIIWQQHINYRIFDNGYYQYQNGLLDKEEWLKYKSIMTTLFEKNPYVYEMWAEYGENFSSSFQVEVEKIINK
jgi:hypothetical protein